METFKMSPLWIKNTRRRASLSAIMTVGVAALGLVLLLFCSESGVMLKVGIDLLLVTPIMVLIMMKNLRTAKKLRETGYEISISPVSITFPGIGTLPLRAIEKVSGQLPRRANRGGFLLFQFKAERRSSWWPFRASKRVAVWSHEVERFRGLWQKAQTQMAL